MLFRKQMCSSRFVRPCGIIVILVGSIASAHAASFYTVDLVASRLKIVSPAGAITDIGPLGRTVSDIDLAILNGHLYAIDSHVGNRVDLLELDRVTGEATFLGVVTVNGQTVLGAESLAHREATLWIGYSLDGSGFSQRLAVVSMNGVIGSNSSALTNVDLDALAWNGFEWRCMDVNAPSSGVSALWGGIGPIFSLIVNAPNSSLGVNDLEYDGSELWGMRQDNSLVHISPDNGALLQSITLASGTYSSLALVSEVCVPPAILQGPADLVVCAGAAAALSVSSIGTSPLAYQWRKTGVDIANGGNIAGATTATLTLNDIQPVDSGSFDCIVTNSCGSATSASAALVVFASGSGDGDASGTTDGLDIQELVNILINGGPPSAGYCAFDLNVDGIVNQADIAGFTAVLLGT